jgi:cytochrome c peroxidase
VRKSFVAVFAVAGLFVAGAAVFQAVAQDQGDLQPGIGALPPPPAGFGRGGRGGGGRGRGPIPLDPAQLSELKTRYAVPGDVPAPADNPTTPAKVALGQKLFFDTGLSGNGRLACASCHDARRGFADPRPLSIGVKGDTLARRTPTVINLAWSQAFFWDGRAATLEHQAVMPIADEKEMGMPHAVMVTQLSASAEYRRLFEAAFPGEAPSVANVGKALAAFERTLVFTQSPFDRWVAGDESAISDSAKRGFVDFNTRAGCAQCHSGWNFSDGKFHDIGLPGGDAGRAGVTKNETDRNLFKTPGLRNIAERAPYMHTGQLNGLGDVLRFYNRGFERRATLSPEMRNVRARGGRDLIAFLETLTTPMPPELLRLQAAMGAQPRASAN